MKFNKKLRKKNNSFEYISQLRQNPISKDWIAIASIRAKRPEQLITNKPKRLVTPKSNCPFEHPQKTGHKPPELIKFLPNKKDWFLQIFENKYPAFQPKNVSVSEQQIGPYKVINGYGYHELLILKDHYKPLADYSAGEIFVILKSLQERYLEIEQDKKIKYISIFHNWGPTAGASVFHPHLQIIAIPVIPPHIQHSLSESHRYWLQHKKCPHCEINKFEMQYKKRVLFQNKNALSYSPFVSLEPFALRVTPIKHFPFFEETPNRVLKDITDVLAKSLKRLKEKLSDPDYNLFIHTAATVEKRKYHCYHWHFEIIPKINVSAGFELCTGIEITTIDPDEGVAFLKK